MDAIQISGTSGSILFDFDNRMIRLLRTGTAVDILKLKDMAIPFDEVTGIEVQQPSMMKAGGCFFIVNGKRMLAVGPSIDVDATQFSTRNNSDFATLESAIRRMCSMRPGVEIRAPKGFDVPKTYYNGPQTPVAPQAPVYNPVAPQTTSGTSGAHESASGTNTVKEKLIQVAKGAVCAQLKSPASARFPAELIAVTGDDVSGYKVTGFVDSQNSYGAMIRNDFSVDLAMVNGSPVVKGAYVAVQANAARAKQFGGNYIATLIMTAIGGLILYLIISAIVGL